MAVNFENKFVFIHITKTGGVAICNKLKLEDNSDAHSNYKTLFEKYGKEYSYHAIIRNPYERFISAYFFMQKYDLIFPNKKGKYKDLFDLGLNGLADLLIQKGFISQLFYPQIYFLQSEKGIPDINLYKFEEFDKTYRLMADFINIEPELKVPVINDSNHEKYSFYYKNNIILAEKIYGLYYRDFKLFGYDKNINDD
ncbi:MAG: sulfotransferase family 2 domain-containing protein [Parachlamydiales bacterium]|jgi:hypothetical protein